MAEGNFMDSRLAIRSVEEPLVPAVYCAWIIMQLRCLFFNGTFDPAFSRRPYEFLGDCMAVLTVWKAVWIVY